jgi:hypothetical protein
VELGRRVRLRSVAEHSEATGMEVEYVLLGTSSPLQSGRM